MRNNSNVLILLVVVFLAGCAGQKKQVKGTLQPGRAIRTTLEIARRAYINGMDSLREGDFEGAFQSFGTASRAPSHVVYSKLARIRLADTIYYQNIYDEAARAYVAFINMNTSNPNLHYAYYRLADSKMRSISGDFFLVPPSDRRDQKQVRSALRSIQSFIANFPDSPYCPQVLEMRKKIVETVSSYEMEVAHFYMTRKKPVGAIGRIERLMKDVPETAGSEKVRYEYVRALSAAGRHEDAVRECDSYLDRFPNGKYSGSVREIRMSSGESIVSAASKELAGDVDSGSEGVSGTVPSDRADDNEGKPSDSGE